MWDRVWLGVFLLALIVIAIVAAEAVVDLRWRHGQRGRERHGDRRKGWLL